MAVPTHTTNILETHAYGKPQWRALDKGLRGHMTGEVKVIADQIQEGGPVPFVLGTDFGVHTLLLSSEGMREFIASMLDMRMN